MVSIRPIAPIRPIGLTPTHLLDLSDLSPIPPYHTYTLTTASSRPFREGSNTTYNERLDGLVKNASVTLHR